MSSVAFSSATTAGSSSERAMIAVWLVFPPTSVANPSEVASIHRIAITELIRKDSPRFVDIPESHRPVIQLPIGGDLIHAPTGAVMYQFRRVAYDGVAERVDGYEQPVFAWL
mgnify:CR=1 FL=1